MPRDNEIGVTANQTAPTGNINAVPLTVEAQPITVHNSIQSNKTSVLADQLAESLGIANKGLEQYKKTQDDIEFKQGTTDAAAGVTQTPQATQFKAYRDAQDHVHALASWAVDEGDIGKQLQQQQFEQNADPKQGLVDANNYLNQTFKDRYAGSSRATMETLAPKMAELRNNYNQWFQKQQQQQKDDKQQSDLKTITGSAFSKAFAPTVDPTTGQPFLDKNGLPIGGGMFDPSKFDYQGINDNVRSLYPGKETNLLSLSNLADIAISHGVPSVLTEMPDHWADGTPTPKGSGDPKMVDEYRHAVKQAQAQQERNLTAADQGNKDAQKDQADLAAKDVLTQIAKGKKFTVDSFNAQFGSLPGVTHHDWQALWEQNQSYGTKQERLNLDSLQTAEGLQEYGSKFNSLKSQVILGTAGYQSLPQVLDQIHGSGYTGVTADKMLSKLAPLVEAAGSNVLKNPEDQGRLNQIRSVYNPGSYDSVSKKFDNEKNNAAREAALQAYHSARAAGTAPDAAMEAADKAAANAGKIYDDTQGKQGEQTRSAAQAYKDTAVTLIPTTAIRKALTENDTDSLRSMGLNAREIQRRMASKEITPDEALALRNKLK
jgi:hypothetical protein